MATENSDQLRERVEARIGLPLSGSGAATAPDPVNLPMIRHWVDAFDDRNAIYLDEESAAGTRHGGLVAPPAMLQTWTMARPRIQGIAARGGAAGEMQADNPLSVLAGSGYVGTLATNSELEFDRYLRLGDHLESSTVLESVSERKATALGDGYFVTWVTDYRDQSGDRVGRQRFRVLKFAPGSSDAVPSGRSGHSSERKSPDGEVLPDFELDVSATVVVAGAIASRDFMPVHHDRDYAMAQGAPDIFMNILTTNGYVSRFVTDWAGPDAQLRNISIRLGGPAVPGQPLRFTGQVSEDRVDPNGRTVEVAVRAANDLGDHATGTVTLDLPARGS